MSKFRPLLVLMLTLSIALSAVQVATSASSGSPTPTDQAYDANVALAESLVNAPPVAAGFLAAIDVADRALIARQALELDTSLHGRLLRDSLAAERANVASANAVAGILAGSGSTSEKAFALFDEGVASRKAIFGITSARTLGFLDQQARAASLAKQLVEQPEADAFDVAQLATQMQAAALGVGLSAPTPGGSSSPSQALDSYAARRSLTVTQEMRDDWIARLDTQPQPVRLALARTIDAFEAFEAITLEEFSTADQAALRPHLAFESVEVNDAAALASTGSPAADWNPLGGAGVDVGRILGARAELLSSSRDLRDALSDAPASAAVACDPVTIPPEDDAPLHYVSIDVLFCPNTYTVPTALSIDVGGNDIYQNNAGGNRLVHAHACDEPHENDPIRAPAAAASFDFDGNDIRTAPVCGANGGASLGAGLLVDVLGDDLYQTVPNPPNNRGNTPDGEGVNGGGHVGIGLLIDAAGSDTYRSGSYAVNGGSLVGIGMLVDGGLATDRYDAGFGGTNGGAQIGLAFLYDDGGNEVYDGEGRASNGGALFGASVLIDLAGDDDYNAFEMSRPRYAAAANGGGKYGAAFLFDALGDDEYIGLRDGVSGGGVDGVGTLIDLAGNDRHVASYNGTIGAGWSLPPLGFFDTCESWTEPDCEEFLNETIEAQDSRGPGIGILIDMLGGDKYYGGMFGTIGGAYIGASFFVDAVGNDIYHAQDGGGAIGGVGGHTLAVGVGFLLDGAGDDAYTTDLLPIAPPGEQRPQFPVEGNATYEFGGKGGNGGACNPGGVGFLADLSGNDRYWGNSSGINGGACNGAVGMLLDGGGGDRYEGADRGINGGAYGGGGGGFAGGSGNGIGAAFGFLVDVSGDDTFIGGKPGEYDDQLKRATPGRGVNGAGYRASGFLYDGDGVDTFTAAGVGTNGGGTRGVGLLVAAARQEPTRATDHYTSAAPLAAVGDGPHFSSNGGADAGECPPTPLPKACDVMGVGLLLDFLGGDHYTDAEPSPFNGSGINKCVVPKGPAPARGQQRDVSISGYWTATSPCAAPPPIL